MEAAETLVPGYRLDRYELLCPIATGGMASVWLAQLRGKRGFEKLFAVKTIKTELISDPHFQEMFLDEARIASRIIHPNVAQILELGEQNDILYIVMEYVDGDSLAKIARLALKRGMQIPPGVALRIIAETCAGLHAAHQLKDASGDSLGVVHRDVSPQNILVTTEGTAKVIDFGLVKAKNRGAGETGQGVVKGKIRYMAPEQVGGKGIDHRADVWAVGMVLYELLTGHVPYPDEDDVEIVQRLMSGDPLPKFDAALPPQLEGILTRAIVKDPQGRFESCSQMRRAIESAIAELELPAENDHVAEFLKEALPDLATKRGETITKAKLMVSEPRLVAPMDGLAPPDIAFAATEISRRNPDKDPPPTRRERKDDDSNRSLGPTEQSTKSATTTTLRDQLGDDKRRSSSWMFVAAAVVVGAGTWILWPRQVPPPPPAALAASASASASASSTSSARTSTLPPTTDDTATDASTTTDDAGVDAGALETAAADASASAPTPREASRPGLAPLPSPDAPPARTFNPAWSILTNPPDGAVPPPPSEPRPTPNPNEPPSLDLQQ